MAATGEVYEFGPYALDVEERRLWNDGHVVPLTPKAHDVLVALVRHAGTLVTKRELLDLVWHDVVRGGRRPLGVRLGASQAASVIPARPPSTSRRCRAPAIGLPRRSRGGLSPPSRCQ